MDGQTDRILLAIPRLHYMERGKNVAIANALQLEATRAKPAPESELEIYSLFAYITTQNYLAYNA